MIKRLKHRRTSGTLVANPRRKKRSGAKRGQRRSLRALFANPRRRKKRKNPYRGIKSSAKRHRNPSRRRKHRNPGLEIGGVDLVSVGVGSVAAIALGSVGQGIFDKYLAKSFSDSPIAKAMPSLIVAGAAFAAHKYIDNPKVKSIAKVTLVLSIFKAIDDSAGDKIRDTVKDVLPGSTSGSYLPALRGYTSGAYMDSTGGAYMSTNGILPGAGLYGL